MGGSTRSTCVLHEMSGVEPTPYCQVLPWCVLVWWDLVVQRHATKRPTTIMRVAVPATHP
jgi:hypothetical protein